MTFLLNFLIELRMKFSKKPWARFVVLGIPDDGNVKFDIAYNKAFIKNLNRQGIIGVDDMDTIQIFLFGTMMYPADMENQVTSDAHPNLQSESNRFRT